ncbi:ABC-2 type transport system ATP-binding protein [Nocardia tenerifensis]|uniref:ABC-2 type transport system ATP-binding protein n=1 Tax=Nocardia tenerifensis TaxID=228006 RepID=A0A318JT16_9NOCA|nr:ABC transporter ATP-binding protein [Nocardia tenerifensis]PXX59676.1 ABC-2 type transport system ATP-binding protein [Nocardia tenerifensis]
MVKAIELHELSKSYGESRGLAELSLEVYRGEVFGYLGPNGAGKSTTIRLLLDLIRPTSGSARVLGLDPRADAVELHARIGYLAGDVVVPGRQRVGVMLRFLARLRGGVDTARIDGLCERLELDQSAQVRSLSKGNRQKLGLVQAFMHTPELLILDEPTSGLDPLGQQTFLDMVTEAAGNGQTVFMSSHIMSEVEAVADRVAIIRAGRLVALNTVAGLRSNTVRDVEIVFTAPVRAAEFAAISNVSAVEVADAVLRCKVAGSPDALLRAVVGHSVVAMTVTEPALEDLFHDYYTGAFDAA